MPDYWPEDVIRPRRPAKSDYVLSRQFKEPMPLPCRLWLAGHRLAVPTHLALGLLK